MKARLWRWGLAAGGIAVLAVAAVKVPQMVSASSDPAPHYQMGTVGRGPVVETVTATGTVQAPETVNVSFQVAGTVAAVPVQLGDTVKKGQTLAQLDSTQLQNQVAVDEGALKAAEANLQTVQQGTAPATIQLDQLNVAKAKVSMQQDKVLYHDAVHTYDLTEPVTGSPQTQSQAQQTLASAKVSYQSAVESYKVAVDQLKIAQEPPLPAQVAQAEAQVTQAKAQLSLANTQVSDMTVTSPVDGIVVTDNINAGQNISVGQVAFAIQAAGSLEAIVPVNEIDIAKVQLGQATQASLNALPGQNFPGKVIQIAPTGTASSGVSTYNVTVSLPDNPHMEAGMSATVTFDVAKAANVVRVPAEAVHGLGTHGYVLVLQGGKPKPQPVKLGLNGNSWIQITSGLHAGQSIVVAQVQSTTGGPHAFFRGPGGFGPHGPGGGPRGGGPHG